MINSETVKVKVFKHCHLVLQLAPVEKNSNSYHQLLSKSKQKFNFCKFDLANFRKGKTKQQFVWQVNNVFPVRFEFQMLQWLLAHTGLIRSNMSSRNHVYLRIDTNYGIIDGTASDQ